MTDNISPDSGDSVYSYRFSKFVVLAVAIMALVALLIMLCWLSGGRFWGGGAQPPVTNTPAVAGEVASDTPEPTTPAASDTPTPAPPTDTPTLTPEPPTDTPEPTAIPPSDTPEQVTEVIPTATNTPAPPSNTPEQVAEVIPTATDTPLPPPSPTPTNNLPTVTPFPRPTGTPTATPLPATEEPRVVLVAPAMGGKLPPGRVNFSGTGPPGARIEVFVDGQPVASATADESGQWTASMEQGPPPGEHEVHAEAQAGSGEVVATSEAATITVLEAITPTTGSEDLPWSVMLLAASALASLGLVFALGGKILRAWDRMRHS